MGGSFDNEGGVGYWTSNPQRGQSSISFLTNESMTAASKNMAARKTKRFHYFGSQSSEALVEAAKANRHGHRDAAMILIAFRHGLRASETV
jgi:hypothetical protein